MAGKGKMKRRHFRSSKIGGYMAEMPNVRGGGREPALDAGTKNKERGRGDGAGDNIARSIWTDAILSGR